MAVTQIDGGRQIKSDTITDTQISSSAAIALSKLAEAVIQADGGQAFTNDQSMGGFKLTNLGTPSSATDAATKGYVDGVATGLDVKASVRAVTTAALSAYTYANGSSGVGATITKNTNGSINSESVDGVTLVTNDRLLVKDETAGNAPYNGIYTVTTVGSGGAAFVLTRATDADTAAEVTAGMFTFIEEGTDYADSGWVLTTNNAITIGTTALSFTQFTGIGALIAGDGLTKTGSTIDVGAGDGITVNVNDVAVNTTAIAGTGLENDGSNNLRIAATAAGAGLAGGGGSALYVDVVIRETPSGTINGSNTDFVLAAAPMAGTEEVYLNGLLQDAGGANDYTISGDTISFNTAPIAGDKIRVSYFNS